MKRKSRTKIVKRVSALLIALVLILTSIQVPAQGALRQDYGSITVADIILAWYNASGVAIGNTNIANAIISAYDSITLNDLIEEGVIVSTIPNSSIEDIKEMLGYGNMSVPVLNINKGKLRTFLGDIPANNVAYDALTAMFNFGTTDIMEGVFAGLASVIGQVANIGKISYNVVRDVVEDIGSNPLWTSVREAYNHFVDTSYFQDLLKSGGGSGGNGSYIWNDNLLFTVQNTDLTIPPAFVKGDELLVYGSTRNSLNNTFSYGNLLFDYRYYGHAVVKIGVNYRSLIVNLNKENNISWYTLNTTNTISNNTIIYPKNSWDSVLNNKNTITGNYAQYITGFSSNGFNVPIGCCLYFETLGSLEADAQYVIDNWIGTDTPISGGVTDYINKEVGNITEENYSILSPNINVGEYMYLADGATYIETLNQITNNTDNGDYSQNGDVITNYNNTYIQNTMQETRPTVGPVASPIPAQPFISPRPTQAPEDYEAVIHQGGIPETIKQKFPFCIPWDLAAVLQNLWAPEARAPYIHWDATFGSWGKLGEVDLDFSIFNDAARIFRATTLILWIIGLVVITRNIIGG